MDSFGDLKLRWASGYNGTRFYFIDNETLVYSCGNILTFLNKTGEHLKSVPSEGRGIGPIATSHGLVAYTEATIEPLIYILSYPECSMILSLKGDAKLEYKSLAFSGDGQKLVSLSGVPDFLLTIWDIKDGIIVCQKTLNKRNVGRVDVSFNPLNWKQLCLVGNHWISLWTVETCDTQILITSNDVKLPETETPVGMLVQPDSKDRETTKSSVKKQESSGGITIPDMSNVFYQSSYDERVKKVHSVLPTSHCWTTHASIYIGCQGGQILLTDFETGVIKMLVNPAISQLHNDSNNDIEDRQLPKTGHAVLCEGAVECLTLGQRGLFTGGKDGQIYCFEQSNELYIIDNYKVDHPITTLILTAQESTLAIGTNEGYIYTMESTNLTQCSLALEHYSSPLVDLDILTPGVNTCITCRQDGKIQIWDIANGQRISTLHLNIECTALVCPRSSQMTVVGTAKGYLLSLSLVDIKNPRLVMKQRVFQDQVISLKTDPCGRFIIAGSPGNTVFVCSARPDQALQVLGYTAVGDTIQDISILPVAWESRAVTQCAVLSTTESSSIVTIFQIPNNLAEEAVDDLYKDTTKLFDDNAIAKKELEFSEPLLAMILVPNNSMFVVPTNSKVLCKLSLPSTDDKITRVSVSDLTSTFATHELANAKYSLSFHQRWLISTGQDGKIILRLIESPDHIVQCIAHHYKNEGGKSIAVTTDGQMILTVGDETTITCWQWELTNHGKTKISTAIEYSQAKIKQFNTLIENQNTFLENLPNLQDQYNGEEHTWLEEAIEEAHKTEDKKYAELKAQLRQEISTLRDKVLSMIASNEEVPDIEKLDRSQFILDTEEHERHQQEEERQIIEVKEEIELANLAKIYLRDLIKRQCWDSMKVKGRIIKAFQNRLEVSNYPMKVQSEESLKELERVKTLRKIEIAERKVREEVALTLKHTTRSSIVPEDLGLEEDDDKKEKEEESDPFTFFGSRASQYGAQSTELLYDQFELVSPITKRHQLVLLKSIVNQIKEAFNKEFDEVLRLKEVEISRILEKNVRIRKIAHDLKVDEEIIEPSLDSDEQPEKLLTVADEEIGVEKYLSLEEQKKAEEMAKQEEERRLKEMGDNWRERALDMMMAGRLEANAEEELFKDLPQPDFMAKDPAELTEDEIRMKHDFEKKEQAWLEEREKLKKALEAEMKKLQETILQSMQTFDEKLAKLFQLKIHTEMTVLQEEIKMLRLSASLLVEEETKMKEELLEQTLNKKKTAKLQLTNLISQSKGQVDIFQEYYEQIAAEDKELDRTFKKDFADCEPYVDQLYKLFRRRPKAHKFKVEGAGDDLPHVKSDNPPYPSSGSLTHKPSVIGGLGRVEDVMSELDNPDNMPDGLEQTQWERFIVARHRKVESERRVKTIAMKLAEMNSFFRKREEEDDQIQNDIQNIFRDLNKLHEDKALYDMDTEIQFLLRQGQVEVDISDFSYDFTDSVLIHRRGIEELNNQIKTLGEAKLASMMECKDFKKGIRMLEWELKRLQMEAEDLIIKAKDVQMLRVTKELQERLMMENIQSKDQHQIETLEKTIELNKKTHRRRLYRFSKHLNSLKDETEKKKQENIELGTQLKEMSVVVSERQNVQSLAGALSSEINAEARMKDVVSRRRLVELAKSQAQEIGVLRTEVERLRMRTFPALVQVDNI